MKKIASTSDFFQAIRQPNAIIFFNASWTHASASSKSCAQKFARHVQWEIPVYEVDLDDFDFVYDWVGQKERTNWELTGAMSRPAGKFRDRLVGNGEMRWIRDGEIVGFESYIAALTFDGLMDRTSFLYWEYLTSIAC